MLVPETDLSTMLSSLTVELRTGAFVYATVEDPSQIDALCPAASIQEAEGHTVVIEKETADQNQIEYDGLWAWLTLSVYSALESVGLTAAVSRALADAGIPANMLAGYHHDHILVPIELADDALAALDKLD